MLPDREYHHIQTVLRGRAGDTFEAVDPERRLYLAELGQEQRATITLEVAASAEVATNIVLYQAVPKGRHMDLVVEKATEMGVARVVPLLTDRGVAGVSESKLDRWRRLAEAAARQSLQLRIPEVAAPITPREALEEAPGGVLLHNGDGSPALEDVVHGYTASLFVGPEGGWSGRELEMAKESGLVLARLGPYRLRSETAGIVAVARAQAALERGLTGPDREKKEV